MDDDWLWYDRYDLSGFMERGRQVAILKAILAGRIYAKDIAESVGIPIQNVYAPLRRLKWGGYIEAKRDERKRRMRYRIKDPIGFMLSDVWTNR